jgi:hypothetical protein
MKPTPEEITQIKKQKMSDKISAYQLNKKKVQNFENWLKSKAISWLKATDFEFVEDRIKWETLEIRGDFLYVNSWNKGPSYTGVSYFIRDLDFEE